DASCPSGTVLVAGICFETARREDASTLLDAMKDCGDEGRYIATPGQLAAFEARHDLTEFEYTSNVYVDSEFRVAGYGDGNFLGTSLFNDLPYRCATGPVG
ncbi:MAG TPA: hypothetical protein VFZ41_04455, partial [Solirubrobacterales bacterium]